MYSFPSLSQSWVHVSRICAASVHAAKFPKLKHCLQEYQWQFNEPKANICPALQLAQDILLPVVKISEPGYNLSEEGIHDS